MQTVIVNVNNLWLKYYQEAEFPEVDDPTDWMMYLLSDGQSILGHYSVLFVNKKNNDCSFFIDLVKVPIDPQCPDSGGLKVTMRGSRPSPLKLQELAALYLGTIESESAANIFIRAHKRLKNMDVYQACCNNCQNYCEELAKEFNCHNNNVFTMLDGIKLTSLITIVGSILIAVVVALVKK